MSIAKKKRRGAPKKDVSADKRICIRITSAQKSNWEHKAKEEKKSLSAWIKCLCDKESN